jgi:hydrogenase maturation protease
VSAGSNIRPDTRPDTRDEVLVLGVGNILWADEGFGVRCAEAFHQRFADAPGVRVMDGGTQGLNLLGDIAGARRVLLFDALDFGFEPGTLVTLRDEEVPRALSRKMMSLHQASVMELLACAGLIGDAPDLITVVGFQPVLLDDYGGCLTPQAQAALPLALVRARQELEAWGIGLEPRAPGAVVEPLMHGSISHGAYAAGRPSEQEACRFGDARFLPAGL